jgi:hypothetical protein
VQPKLLHWSLPVSTVRGQWHVITCDAFGVPSRIATESYETTEVPGFWVDEPTGERLPSGNPKQRSVYRPTSDDDPEEPGYIEG